MIPGGEEDWKPNAAGWLEKYQINLDTDYLHTTVTGKSRTLAWQQTL